jgi:hypothetical protein
MTYTVTTTNKSINFSYTYEGQSAAQVKQIKTRFANNKAMKVTAVRDTKCYYHGEEVHVIEEQYMGWTLVTATGKSAFRAVTRELEWH